MRKRSRIRTLVAGAVVGAAVVSGTAGQAAPIGWSENVEWLKSVPIVSVPTEATGASFLIGDVLYLHDGVEGLNIYDVADPENPVLINEVATRGPNFWPSDDVGPYTLIGRMNTNGKILLMPGYNEESNYVPPPYNLFPWPGDPPSFTLYVYDISNPARERRLGKLTTHNGITGPFCILGCRWAYDRFGAIVDLRDPTKPKLAGNWTKGLRFRSSTEFSGPGGAEFVEVAPGIVLTGTVPMYLLDTRKDPRHPKVLGRSDGSPSSRGDIAWPGFPSGDVVVTSNVGGNVSKYQHCAENDKHEGTPDHSSFAAWDVSDWERTGLFTKADHHLLKNGTYQDGDPPISGYEPRSGGCKFNRFDVRRASDGGLLVAAAARGHGMKILHVSSDGEIESKGWFLGAPADSWNTFWVTDEIVYNIDTDGELQILRYTGEL